MFNNSDVISTSTDERILSGSELKNNSAILREYKDPYFKQYLNSIRNWTVRQPEPERLDTLPAGLLSSINTIIGTNPERAAILLGLQRFYTNWPTSNRSTLEISGTRPKVKFTTYGETTEINLQDRNVTGLDANAAFADHFELFKAANLINFTKKVCKSKDTEK
jgi:hypothetical protein